MPIPHNLHRKILESVSHAQGAAPMSKQDKIASKRAKELQKHNKVLTKQELAFSLAGYMRKKGYKNFTAAQAQKHLNR
jgi:hypothetical protein